MDAATITPAENPFIIDESFFPNWFLIKKTIVAPRVVAANMMRQPKIVVNVLFIALWYYMISYRGLCDGFKDLKKD